MKKNIAILINEDIEHPKDYGVYALDDLSNLTKEYENVYIGDLLDYIDPDTTKDVLQEIINKLEKNGKLHIKAPDIFQLCWYCAKFNLDILKLRYIIYENRRRTCYTMEEVVRMLGQIPGVQIESASYANLYEYSITVKKNEPN